MNKKISFPIAIIIILTCAVLIGIIAWQYRFIPEIEIPPLTPSEKIPKDETTDWKVYNNENFRIELKYPKNFVILNEDETLVTFQNISKPSQVISILKSSGPPPETMRYKPVESKIIYFINKLELDRELFQGKFEDNKDDYYVRVFIPEKAIFYQGDFKKENLEEFLLIYNQILSTFRFLERI